MSDKIINNLKIEGATVRFRNFAGEEGRYNPKGKRNFCVFLDSSTANDLADDGWNIRWLQPREDDEPPQAYMQIAVSFDHVPPKVNLVTSRGLTPLDEDGVNILDWAEFSNVDLIIRPYVWEVNGKTGVKAYLKTGYFSIMEDDLEKKYANVPESAASNMEVSDEEGLPFR